MKFYNILIDISDKLCIVIGGGRVGLRKAKKLLEAKAEVVVVAEDFLPDFYKIENKNLSLKKGRYEFQLLEGAFLVFAATSDREVNQQVCEDAKAQGILVNSVNNVDEGSFIVPASCKKEYLQIGIATDGLAPALSKELRKYIKQQLDSIENHLLIEIADLRKKMLQTPEEDIKQTLAKKVAEVIKQLGSQGL